VPTYASISVPLARVEPGDWDWTALGTIATALAALVTAITIIFVAKQTSATTKAAQEAQRSADAAHRALDHSQKQLEYSHQQHQQSLYMAVETVKARIDADMPRLITEDVTVLPEIFMEDGSGLLPVLTPAENRAISAT
jgi:mannitol-specific phosphotransferase system IIBC component